MKSAASAPPPPKRILPDGTPPVQPTLPSASTSSSQGGRQILRVNRACKTCRKQKMRCEGPENPPCARCKAAGTECVFERVNKETEENSDRLREMERRIESISDTQMEMKSTLEEILNYLRGNSDEPSGEQTQPEMHATGEQPQSEQGSRSRDERSSQHTYVFSPTEESKASWTPLGPDPIESHEEPERQSAFEIRPHVSPEAHYQSVLGVKQQRRSPPPEEREQPPSKKRRRNDLRYLLHEDDHWENQQLEESSKDTYSDKAPDVIDKVLVNESEAQDLWRLYFEKCHFFLPVLNPQADTFASIRTRSPLCFCAVLFVAAKMRDGANEPSPLQQVLRKEVQDLMKESMLSSSEGIEKVQALMIASAWGRSTGGTGWFAAGHAIRCAVDLGMQRALPRLAKKVRDGTVDTSEVDRLLIISARVWTWLCIFENMICMSSGRPPMCGYIGDTSDVRAVFLRHPLALPGDIRLASTCEMYALMANWINATGGYTNFDLPIDSLELAMHVKNACDSVDTWRNEWDAILSKFPAAAVMRGPLNVNKSLAIFVINARVIKRLPPSSDITNVSPHVRELVRTALLSAKTSLENALGDPFYCATLPYAMSQLHSTLGFAGTFLLRFCRLFPGMLDLSHAINLIDKLLPLLNRNPPSIFIHRLKLLLHACRQNVTPVPPPLTWPSSIGLHIPLESVHTQLDSNNMQGTSEEGPMLLQLSQHAAPHDNIFYSGWSMPHLQIVGANDIPEPGDFIHAQFAGDL